ncbi:MAG: hypothetical protein OXF85_00505 [Candidatus Saccharibacteria bacterium]|nr:hypothetical protein [Candidatus Saccharibacteria bacterium]MCY4010465.1 hypothetical protein [Candidatus Saccharibacteria bacterium]MCY4088670.1 hypothetical protein [Candidatus Saccharibacteria bacterium]
MKYLSILFTILLIWISILIIVAVRPEETGFELFLTVIVCTLALFLIGFVKK